MIRLLRYAPLIALTVVLAAPSAARPADDLPTPPKSGTIVTAGQDRLAVSAARSRSANSLKQIALAFHNFESAYAFFPAGISGPHGEVGLSWRVQVLPYIEQQELYKEFKLDEAWDSAHNRKLIAKMPKLYAPPKGETVAEGLTYYRSFSGPSTLMPPPREKGKAGLALPGTKIAAISDGTSNTFLAAEAADPVMWTKPDELEYNATKPVPKLGGIFEGGFNAAMCDGAVRFLPSTIDDKTLRALITINNGENVRIP